MREDEFAAVQLAEYHLGDLRNSSFHSLTAGTVTQENLSYDGLKFTLVRKIDDIELLTEKEKVVAEEKGITITVWPFGSTRIEDSVTLYTIRSITRPGPNRENNTSE